MINNEELKLLSKYFADVEVPEELEVVVKKLHLIEQIQVCEEKLQELMKPVKE